MQFIGFYSLPSTAAASFTGMLAGISYASLFVINELPLELDSIPLAFSLIFAALIIGFFYGLFVGFVPLIACGAPLHYHLLTSSKKWRKTLLVISGAICGIGLAAGFTYLASGFRITETDNLGNKYLDLLFFNFTLYPILGGICGLIFCSFADDHGKTENLSSELEFEMSAKGKQE